MNHLLPLFFYASALFLFLLPLWPALKLSFFVPFLIKAYYQKDKIGCLWLSLLCGLILDLFSSSERLGFYAFNYCTVTYFLYSQKRHFFEESLSTLPIMTFSFAFLSTLIHFCLLYVFGKNVQLSFAWVTTDLFFFPLIDAFYAGLLFTLPSLFFSQPQRRRTAVLSMQGNYK